MNHGRRLLTHVPPVLLLLGQLGVAQAELALVVHPSNRLEAMTLSDVSRIYLGMARAFPDGAHVKPVDQNSGSPARAEFYETFTGRTEIQAKTHWSKLMFSGKGQPPQEIDGGDAEVKAAVAQDPAAIGYIDPASVDASVKVLTIIR